MPATNYPEFNAAVTELTDRVELLLTDVGKLQSVASVQVAVDKAAEASTSATSAASSATAADGSKTAAASSATAADGSKTAAASSATAAASSATAAASSATAANTSKVAAASSATAASTAATSAGNSATASDASKAAAANSATAADSSKTAAAGSATAAASSATAASSSSTKASQWADAAENTVVETGKYSAKHHAAKAAASATAADGSKTAAAGSATSASTSASTATTKATEAAASATAADGSKTAAAGSATSASTSASTATTKATEAAASATAADGSKTAAAGSATSASTSASTATTKATEAAASATAANTSKVAAETARDTAVAAAASLTGSLVEAGSIDLSGGTYPAIPPVSSFWKVTVGGTAGGVPYGVGDTLVYSKTLTQFYKIDNTESVSSVNGQSGAVLVEPVIAAGTAAQMLLGNKTWASVLSQVQGTLLTGLSLATGTAITAADTVLSGLGKLQKQITDAATNLAANVRSTAITGYVVGSNAALAATDTVLGAFGKLQAQITGLGTSKLDATANAVSATKLATASTINGVAFDGTANITVDDPTKVPLAGGNLTGDLIYQNVGVGGWARGLTAKIQSTAAYAAGIGFYGSGDSVTTVYLGLGAGPWSSGNGVRVTAAGVTISGATTFDTLITGSVNGNAATATTLTGLTPTVAELNYVDGVTSSIQTQLNAKAPLASPALTGVPTVPTAAVGTNTTQVASTAYTVAEIDSRAPTKAGVGASGTWPVAITGNAATATKLATARTINGVAFDGTADISIAAGETGRLPLTGGAVTGKTSFTKTEQTTYDTAAVEIGAQSGAAYIGFHRHGVFGGLFGVDTGNNFYGNSGLTMTGNITAYSDIRLKTDIEVISDALNKVCTLRGVTYTRIEGNERQTGVIAQEVQAVLPEAVKIGEDVDQTLSVAYGNLVGLLIEAIKELKAEVDELKRGAK